MDVARNLLHQLLPGMFDGRQRGAAPSDDHHPVRGLRVVLGAVVGAGLAVIGMTLQALVHNPLADPYLLGSPQGASGGRGGR